VIHASFLSNMFNAFSYCSWPFFMSIYRVPHWPSKSGKVVVCTTLCTDYSVSDIAWKNRCKRCDRDRPMSGVKCMSWIPRVLRIVRCFTVR